MTTAKKGNFDKKITLQCKFQPVLKINTFHPVCEMSVLLFSVVSLMTRKKYLRATDVAVMMSLGLEVSFYGRKDRKAIQLGAKYLGEDLPRAKNKKLLGV